MAETPQKDRTLKQRIENNFIAVFFTGCATVAVVAAGAGIWIGEQRVRSNELAWEARLTTRESELKNEFSSELVAAKGELQEQVIGLKTDLREVSLERDKLIAWTGIGAEGGGKCDDPRKCRHLSLSSKIVALLDPEATTPGVDTFFDNRIIAMRDGMEGVREASFPLGGNLRFLYDPDFEFDALTPEPGGAEEHFWLLEESSPVIEHPVFQRFAPFFVVYKMPFISADGETLPGADDPVWQVFQRDFQNKFDSAKKFDLTMRVKRIEQEGVVLFAHFQTILKKISVGETRYKRLFLNEMQFVVPVRNDGVYVVKSAFTSKENDHRLSPHWVKVLGWWDKLKINTL